MSWAVGFDTNWNRDIGYGVPAICDHPDCNAEIDRGLSFACGSEPYGGEHGCGLYFCSEHLKYSRKGRGKNARTIDLCRRCRNRNNPFPPKPDHPDWIRHKETDPSWAEWRAERDGASITPSVE